MLAKTLWVGSAALILSCACSREPRSDTSRSAATSDPGKLPIALVGGWWDTLKHSARYEFKADGTYTYALQLDVNPCSGGFGGARTAEAGSVEIIGDVLTLNPDSGMRETLDCSGKVKASEAVAATPRALTYKVENAAGRATLHLARNGYDSTFQHVE